MSIALIGLGRMGSAMARRLLSLDPDLIVFDRDAERRAALAADGARVAASVREAVLGCAVVITMVTDDRALDQLAIADGLIEALPRDAVHAAMGTHSVALVEALAVAHAAAGQGFVAAPVLGRPDMAAAGTLGVVVGGPPAARQACQTAFSVIGNRTFLAGDTARSAAAIKIANNALLGCAIQAMGEAFALVGGHGVGRHQFQAFLGESLFTCPAYAIYSTIIADESYDRVGVTALIGLKDANLALAAAEATHVSMPSVDVWRDSLLRVIADGDGAKDWSVMTRGRTRDRGAE